MAGWSMEIDRFELTDTAVLRWAYFDPNEAGMTASPVWWVEMNEEGGPFEVAESSPQEAIAEWLRMMDE